MLGVGSLVKCLVKMGFCRMCFCIVINNCGFCVFFLMKLCVLVLGGCVCFVGIVDIFYNFCLKK